jgi:hypothetical protein
MSNCQTNFVHGLHLHAWIQINNFQAFAACAGKNYSTPTNAGCGPSQESFGCLAPNALQRVVASGRRCFQFSCVQELADDPDGQRHFSRGVRVSP